MPYPATPAAQTAYFLKYYQPIEAKEADKWAGTYLRHVDKDGTQRVFKVTPRNAVDSEELAIISRIAMSLLVEFDNDDRLGECASLAGQQSPGRVFFAVGGQSLYGPIKSFEEIGVMSLNPITGRAEVLVTDHAKTKLRWKGGPQLAKVHLFPLMHTGYGYTGEASQGKSQKKRWLFLIVNLLVRIFHHKFAGQNAMIGNAIADRMGVTTIGVHMKNHGKAMDQMRALRYDQRHAMLRTWQAGGDGQALANRWVATAFAAPA